MWPSAARCNARLAGHWLESISCAVGRGASLGSWPLLGLVQAGWEVRDKWGGVLRAWPSTMSLETRSNSALIKRSEQLKRWQDSETFRELGEPRTKNRRVNFSDGCVFLAACAAGDREEVKTLLGRGADIDTANVDGLTALHQVGARRATRQSYSRFYSPPVTHTVLHSYSPTVTPTG